MSNPELSDAQAAYQNRPKKYTRPINFAAEPKQADRWDAAAKASEYKSKAAWMRAALDAAARMAGL